MGKMPNSHPLSKIGLNETEIEVYLTLLRVGGCGGGEIVRATGLPRATVYGALHAVVEKGLAGKSERGGKTIFFPELPEKTVRIAERRVAEAQRGADEIKRFLPFLLSTADNLKSPGKVRVYEGENAVRSVLFDSLECGREAIRTYSNVYDMENFAGAINAEYVAERKKRKVHKLGLILDTPFAKKYLTGYDRTVTDFKLFPLNGEGFHGELNIYNGRMSYVTYRANMLVGFVVEEPDLCRLQQTVFDLTWAGLPEFGKRN